MYMHCSYTCTPVSVIMLGFYDPFIGNCQMKLSYFLFRKACGLTNALQLYMYWFMDNIILSFG